MELHKSTTRNIEIDGMTGDACVQKVSIALKGLRNVSTQSVKVGSAHLNTDDEGCKTACAAITTAGYKAREQNAAPKATPFPATTEHKGAQPTMSTANDKHAAGESDRFQENKPVPPTVTT